MVKPMKGHAETSLPLQAGGKAERQLGPYGYSGNHCWGRTNVLSLYPREEPRHQQLNPPPPLLRSHRAASVPGLRPLGEQGVQMAMQIPSLKDRLLFAHFAFRNSSDHLENSDSSSKETCTKKLVGPLKAKKGGSAAMATCCRQESMEPSHLR